LANQDDPKQSLPQDAAEAMDDRANRSYATALNLINEGRASVRLTIGALVSANAAGLVGVISGLRDQFPVELISTAIASGWGFAVGLVAAAIAALISGVSYSEWAESHFSSALAWRNFASSRRIGIEISRRINRTALANAQLPVTSRNVAEMVDYESEVKTLLDVQSDLAKKANEHLNLENEALEDRHNDIISKVILTSFVVSSLAFIFALLNPLVVLTFGPLIDFHHAGPSLLQNNSE
jgi:hypothetical protein